MITAINKKLIPDIFAKRFLPAISIILLLCGMSYASFSKGEAGTTGAAFLKLGAGASASAMGEACAATVHDTNSIYWNPAGLNNVEAVSLSVMHAAWFEDIAYDWASFAIPFKNWGVAGVGVQYLSYGRIKKTDDTGLETGNFSPADLCVSFAYAMKFRGVDLGANAKYISMKIVKSAAAFAVDLGAQYKAPNMLDNKLSLGLAVQNIGTKVKFITEEDSLPVNIKLGGAYHIKENWEAVLDINAPIDNEVSFGTGTEYAYKVNETITALGRLGYNTRSKDTGGLNGVTAGLGVIYGDYSFDYAFVPYGELGNTHRISLGIKF